MTGEQLILFAILAATLALFVWGRWRHDTVALGALIASVSAGLVPAGSAFEGFANPAVITVACVLVLSHGLQTSGAVDLMARGLLPESAGPSRMILGLTAASAVLSAFMNNVAALTLLMPVGLQAARRLDLTPGRVLMPLAFGSLLGGMTTLIGTPPNLIVSSFRAELVGAPFGMFSFAPVGVAVALAGVLFIGLVGWRLVPARTRAGVDDFDTGAYLTEARIPEGAPAAGMTIGAVETALGDAGAQVVGLVRNEVHLRSPRAGLGLRAGDILVLEAEPEALADALATLGIRLDAAVTPDADQDPQRLGDPTGTRRRGL